MSRRDTNHGKNSKMNFATEILRLFFFVGWRRQLLLLLVMLCGAIAENFSIASLWPIFRSTTSLETKPSPAAELIEDVISATGLQPSLGVLLLFLCGAAIVKFVLSTGGLIFVGRQIAQQSMRLRLELIDAITRSRWSHLISIPSGRLTAALGDEAERASSAFSGASTLAMKGVETLAYLVGCLWVSWQFSVAAVFVAAVLWLVVAPYIYSARRAGRKKWKSTHMLSGAVSDLLTSMKTLRAMNRHAYLGHFAAGQISSLRRSVEREYYSASAIRALQEPLLAIMLVVGLYVGHRFFELQLVELIASVWLLRRIADGVAAMRGSIQRIAVDGFAFWSIIGLTESMRAQAETLHSGAVARLDRSCKFQDVSFSYGSKVVVDSVSFDLPVGEVATLIGPSGSGKTTIADLLVGLHEPDSGQILIDGLPLSEANLAQWRSNLGYIPQDSILFNDTVFENVALGDPSIAEADVIEALKLAGAWDFVSRLPNGVHEVIGVRGNLLSGGQKQRLSIARALIHRPQLLILDEATSALDLATAQEICNGVRELRSARTVLAITHQSIWIGAADQVLMLSNGRASSWDPAGFA